MSNFLWNQVRKNSVALISLVIAITSLSYNTWRNEATEQNRNVRFAGFEVILKLGELQRVVFHAHYDKDIHKGNPRTGWVIILQLNDLGRIMPEPMPTTTKNLLKAWQQHWSTVGTSEKSLKAINTAIDQTREHTLSTLRALE